MEPTSLGRVCAATLLAAVAIHCSNDACVEGVDCAAASGSGGGATTGSGGPGSTASSGGGGNGGGGCDTSACGADTDCRTPTCDEGACGVELAPAGTACDDGDTGAAALCDGEGQCVECLEDGDCATNLCLEHACVTCADADDCAAEDHCALASNGGTCATDRANGSGCSADDACISDTCVDDVCCADACAGKCSACDNPGSQGACSFVPLGEMDAACAVRCGAGGRCSGEHLGSVALRDDAFTNDLTPNSGAIDGAGNVLVGGFFNTRVNAGGDDLVSVGARDGWVAKLDPNGKHLWSKAIGRANENIPQGEDITRAIAVDGDDNVLVAVDGSGVAKLAPDGTPVWSHPVGTNRGYGLTTDGAGDVYVTGRFPTGTAFGGACGTKTASGVYDLFVARLDGATGACKWVTTHATTGADSGFSVALDPDGDVLVSGNLEVVADVTESIIVMKLDRDDGSSMWTKTYAGVGEGWGVRVDPAGAVYVTGYFRGTIDFGGMSETSAGGYDVFLLKLAADGATQWVKRFGGTANDFAYVLNIEQGTLVVAGGFEGSFDLGADSLIHQGGRDPYVAAFDTDGNYLYAKWFGATSFDQAAGVAVRGGAVVLYGLFSDDLTIDGTPLAHVVAGRDTFVSRFAL